VKSSRTSAIGAGVAGASSGTLLVAVAEYIETKYPGSKVFVHYAAPTVAVSMASTVGFCHKYLLYMYKTWQLKKLIPKINNMLRESESQLSHLSERSDKNEKEFLINRIERLHEIKRRILHHEIDLLISRPDGLLSDLSLSDVTVIPGGAKRGNPGRQRPAQL
jgi:hypothetical protein